MRAMNLLKYSLFVFLLTALSALRASDLTKAFKYLNTGDYANAQKYLLEVIQEEPDNAAGNFGMAKFYFLKDNKAYNLDSANLYILKAVKKIPFNPDDKQTKKYLTLGVRDYTIKALQQDINEAEFAKLEKENTVEAYQHFINYYSDAGLNARAVAARNQVAYLHARAKNDPWALNDFLKTYPDAEQAPEAKQLFEKLLYEQTTADKTYTSYKKYMDSYPSGAFFNEAKKNYQDNLLAAYNEKHTLADYVDFEKNYKDHPAINAVQDSIYVLATKSGTLESFKNFIDNYKTNRHYKDAYTQYYILYTAEATEDVYHKFWEAFTDFPDRERVQADLQLAKLDLKSFSDGGKSGYIIAQGADSGKVIIKPEYEETFAFKCGVAAVRSAKCTDVKCKYYYIDKNNKRVFTTDFNYAGDFDKGIAIAGIGNCEADSCKYGIIDKRGKWTVQPVYDELDDPTSGLYAVSRKDKYGFINSRGEEVIALKYSNASPFSEGVASVALDTNWFFIDSTGRQLFIANFHDVSSFKEGLCAVTNDGDSWGYIDKTGAFVIPALYEDATDFDSGFAIVSKKEKDPKHKGLFISQRYKIDLAGAIVEKLTAPKPATKKTSGRKRGR